MNRNICIVCNGVFTAPTPGIDFCGRPCTRETSVVLPATVHEDAIALGNQFPHIRGGLSGLPSEPTLEGYGYLADIKWAGDIQFRRTA